jgi:hypothetical protein
VQSVLVLKSYPRRRNSVLEFDSQSRHCATTTQSFVISIIRFATSKRSRRQHGVIDTGQFYYKRLNWNFRID